MIILERLLSVFWICSSVCVPAWKAADFQHAGVTAAGLHESDWAVSTSVDEDPSDSLPRPAGQPDLNVKRSFFGIHTAEQTSISHPIPRWTDVMFLGCWFAKWNVFFKRTRLITDRGQGTRKLIEMFSFRLNRLSRDQAEVPTFAFTLNEIVYLLNMPAG